MAAHTTAEPQSKLDAAFEELFAACDDEGDATEATAAQPKQTINQESEPKTMSVDMSKIREQLAAIKAKAETPKITNKDWLPDFVGTKKFYLVPFNDGDLFKERSTHYLDGRYVELDQAATEVVNTVRMGLFKAGKKDDGKKLWPRNSIALQLVDPETGEVKLKAFNRGGQNPQAGDAFLSELTDIIGSDPDNLLGYALEVTGATKSMGNGKTYTEFSVKFARKPSKAPAVKGELPKYDVVFIDSDETVKRLGAMGIALS